MTIHVNIGDAKTRLSELIAAAVGGEDIVLDKAGTPQVRLVPVTAMVDAELAATAASRASAFGMYRHLANDPDLLVRESRMTEDELEASYRRKFGPAD